MFVIFLHLHKCGGTSFINLINEKYKLPIDNNGIYKGLKTPKTKEELIDTIDKLKNEGYSSISFEWSCPIITNLENVKYICVFRYPIERLISNYFYDKKIHKKIKSLKDFINFTKYDYFYNYNCYYEFFKDYENQDINEIIKKISKIDYIINLNDKKTFKKLTEIGLNIKNLKKLNENKTQFNKKLFVKENDLINKCHLDIEIFKLLSSYF